MTTYPNRIKIQPGNVFHKLTALAPNGHDKHGRSVWLFACECGQQTCKAATYVAKGKVKSCGCLMPETKNRKRDPNTGHFLLFGKDDGLPGRVIAAKAVWINNSYQDGYCSFEDFLHLSQEPCHYCGAKHSCSLKRKGEVFFYNGLDRKDPGHPHSPDNIIPCCKPCNYAKHTQGYEQFMLWLERAYIHSLPEISRVKRQNGSDDFSHQN